MKEVVDDFELDVPSDYEPVVAMLIDEEGMWCFTHALYFQSRRLKQFLLDPNYPGDKTFLSALLQTNKKIIQELDK